MGAVQLTPHYTINPQTLEIGRTREFFYKPTKNKRLIPPRGGIACIINLKFMKKIL